jgi:uncharacterized damage-inducible protein DinB
MSKLEMVRSLFEYNEWANEQVLEAAARVDEEELTREREVSFGSLQGLLLHILGSHVSWLMKWTGETPPIAKVEPGRAMAAIGESYESGHERLREFVESLSDERLDEVSSLMDPQDGEWRTWHRPFWQVTLSVGSHAMGHRAEAAMILSGLGSSPGEIDYSYFCWRRHPD